MSARCLVVCPDLAALAETVGDFGMTYRWDADANTHASRFYSVLKAAIDNIGQSQYEPLLNNAQSRANIVYNWAYRVREWEALLKQLVSKPS
jgi:hypothetical protein